MRQGDLETYQKLLPRKKWRRERRRERIHRAWNRGKVVVEKEKICFLKNECFLWGRGKVIYSWWRYIYMFLFGRVCWWKAHETFHVSMNETFRGRVYFFLGVPTVDDDWAANVAKRGSRTRLFSFTENSILKWKNNIWKEEQNERKKEKQMRGINVGE